MARPAHSVLVAPVSEADLVVRAFTAAHPQSRRTGGPNGLEDTYAHVTVLGPFLPREGINAQVYELLSAVLRGRLPIGATFSRVERFADGLVWLAPDDPRPFRDLTDAVQEAFPGYPPYAGEFDDVVPHLTLGHCNPGDHIRALVSPIEQMLPVRTYVGHLDLVWVRPGEGVELLGKIHPS